MSYRLAIKPSAQRELERLDDALVRRIDAVLLKLAGNPRPQGFKKLTGVPLYRIRVGAYRLVYEINDPEQLVTIVTIGHRRDIYR